MLAGEEMGWLARVGRKADWAERKKDEKKGELARARKRIREGKEKGVGPAQRIRNSWKLSCFLLRILNFKSKFEFLRMDETAGKRNLDVARKTRHT